MVTVKGLYLNMLTKANIYFDDLKTYKIDIVNGKAYYNYKQLKFICNYNINTLIAWASI